MTLVASVDYETFPECPAYGFQVQPEYLVSIIARQGGYERIDPRWTSVLNVYTAVPMGNRAENDIQNVLNFWHAMGGRSSIFRLKDWVDYKSCAINADPSAVDQPVVDTGQVFEGKAVFQLTKNYTVGSIIKARPISQPVGSTISFSNEVGAVQADTTWTLDESTGLVFFHDEFEGTPTAWGGEFMVAVRFDSELEIQTAEQHIESLTFTLRERRIKPVTDFTDGSSP